jgi:mannose-1-phosphate guanylyltransferase
MRGMILAAGYGTRFRPATYLTPKPLIPLCNRPLISYAIEALRDAGISEMVINLHHLPEPLEAWVQAAFPSIRVHFSFEEKILGTGGGIRKVRSILEGEPSFILVNGDTIQRPSFMALEEKRAAHGDVAALSLRHAPPGDRFTRVFCEDGRITGFGKGTGQALMFSGAHAISREIFEILPDRAFSGITEDVYMPLLEHGGGLAGVIDDGPWFDIGTPLRYFNASDDLRLRILSGSMEGPEGTSCDRERRNLAGPESRSSERCLDSVLGRRVNVSPSAKMQHSIVWDDSTVDSDSTLRDAILGDGIHLGPGSTIVNALVCRAMPGTSFGEESVVRGGLAAAPIDPSKPTTFEPSLTDQ